MTELARYNDPTKGALKTQMVEGMEFMEDLMKELLRGKSIKEHVEDVKNLAIRDDDIIVCAYAKCGTHWVWEILNVLLIGKVNKQPKETRMLEFTPTEQIDSLKSPRILNTHNPPHLLPKGIKERKTKIVYIYRNPKDVAISAYFHMTKGLQSADANIGDLDTFRKVFPTLNHPYNFFKYIREFDDFLNTNVNIPRIIMTYEDLSHHPTDNVKRLARFLGLDCSDEKIAEVVKSCSFDNMKKADAEFKEEFKGKRTKDGESAVFRKGKVGDWKNYFTVAESEMYDEFIQKDLKGYAIEFRFT